MILASASPRRRDILRRYGIEFSVECAEVTELRSADVADLRTLPQLNARLKAEAVAQRHLGELVLGADTVIFFENQIIGKPQSPDEAAQFLRMFSGKEHEVITGMALICGTRREVWSESSFVRFKVLDDAAIARYLSLVPVLDKAGAYAIQEHGEIIIDHYSGDLDNIIGLPATSLISRLANCPRYPVTAAKNRA